MMNTVLKVDSWTPTQAQDILKQRLELAKQHRKENQEPTWRSNETQLFHPGGDPSLTPTLSYNSLAEVFQSNANTSPSIHIPRVAQNMRFLHSQMSANPPSVIPRPTSNELADRRTTEAVDDLIQYGRTHYKLQEHVDLTSLSTLTYGTGFIKSYHDPTAGSDVLNFDEESMEITMAGDFKARTCLIWNIWIDRDARHWEDVRYYFERHLMPYSQAVSIWPDYAETFQQFLVDARNHPDRIGSIRETTVDRSKEDLNNALVEIFEYTEKGLPENGMAGRRAFHMEDGQILGRMTPNPHPDARLPLGILTDIDVPGEVYGKTVVDYAISLAGVVDSLDNMILNNIELHGSIKLVVFDQAETNDENYSDDPVDIITVNGTHAHSPFYLKPASVSVDLYNLRQQMLDSIDGVMGVNEILQGEINRELSGFASQTAINAANMVRHRLFNKYTAMVEFVYETYLANVQKYWKVKRKLKVLGKEDGPTLRYLEGADIEGGYALQVEYGTSFSLDPALRREEIMQAKETLLEAGVNPKKIAQMLRYNEVDNLFDSVETAKKRQLEIFERAIQYYNKTGKIKVQSAKVMRKAFHLEMAEAATEFVMTNDFLGLDDDLKEAIYDHIDEREQLAAAQAAPAGPAGPAGPGQPPMPGGMPPMGPPGAGGPPMPDIGGVL